MCESALATYGRLVIGSSLGLYGFYLALLWLEDPLLTTFPPATPALTLETPRGLGIGWWRTLLSLLPAFSGFSTFGGQDWQGSRFHW